MFVLLSLFALTSATITDCSVGKGLFTITELKLDPPSAVAANQNVSLVLKYTSPVIITGGTAETAITLNYIPFQPSSENLCNSVFCPLGVGSHDSSTFYIFPSGISGRIITQIKWFDLSGTLLLCIKTVLTATGMNHNHTGALWKIL